MLGAVLPNSVAFNEVAQVGISVFGWAISVALLVGAIRQRSALLASGRNGVLESLAFDRIIGEAFRMVVQSIILSVGVYLGELPRLPAGYPLAAGVFKGLTPLLGALSITFPALAWLTLSVLMLVWSAVVAYRRRELAKRLEEEKVNE